MSTATSSFVIRMGKVQGIRVPMRITSTVGIPRRRPSMESSRASESIKGSPPEINTSLTVGFLLMYPIPSSIILSVMIISEEATFLFLVQKRQYIAHSLATRKRTLSGYLWTRLGTGLRFSSSSGSGMHTESRSSVGSGTACFQSGSFTDWMSPR